MVVDIVSTIGNRFKTEFIGRVIATTSGAILTVALARVLDPDGYGLLFLAISVFGIVELVSKLGIAKSAARYIAKFKETDPTQLRHILRFSFVLNLGTITIVCIALFASQELLVSLLGEPDLTPFLMLGVFFLAFATLMKYVRTVLQGFEDIKGAATLHALDRVARLVLAIGLAVIGYGAVGALGGYIIAYAAASLTGVGYIYIRYYRNSPIDQIDTGLQRRIVEYTVPLTVTNTAGVLDKRVDTLLVGFFVGPVAVSFYTIGKQVVQFIEMPMSALGFTLSPIYETEKAKGNTEMAAEIYEEALFHGLLLYIPAAAGLVLVADPLVELVFGNDYLGAVPVLQVLAIYAVLQSVTKLTSNGLDYLGRARSRAIVKGATAVLNVVLNLYFIPLFGVVGAAIATVISYSIYTFANIYIMHTELSLRLIYLFYHICVVLIITAVMSAVVYLVSGFINGFVTLFAVVGLGVAVWLVLVVSTGILDIRRVFSVLS